MLLNIPDEYLGDGVYASWDGWGHGIVLDLRAQSAGGHFCKIGLEVSVLEALEEYRKRIAERIRDHHMRKEQEKQEG